MPETRWIEKWARIASLVAPLLAAACVDPDESLDDAEFESGGIETAATPGGSGLANPRYWGSTRFDEMTWLGTHNSFTNYEDAAWVVANQSHGIRKQLDRGVRALMLDTHWFPGTMSSKTCRYLGRDCHQPGVYLCHGGTECSGVLGVNYAYSRQRLDATLNTVADFLVANPSEVVTIWLEDYTNGSQLRDAVNASRARNYLFKPNGWIVNGFGPRNGQWPKIADMVTANQRLLLLTDRGRNAADDSGILYVQNYTVENYWSLTPTEIDYDLPVTLNRDLSCVSRWSNKPLSSPGLFTMNHYRDVPTLPTAIYDNQLSGLKSRVDNYCRPAAGRDPNYIVVDFYNSPDDAAMSYVNRLNRERGVPRP